MKELKISLAAARVNAGMTQEEVAKKLQVSNKTVVNWEKGSTVPKKATIMALASLYRIPEQFFNLPEKST